MKEFIHQWSKQLDIPENKLIKILTHLKEKHLYWESFDKNWKYPSMGDSQRTCPMLDAMFYIEQRKGVILFLPMEERE